MSVSDIASAGGVRSQAMRHNLRPRLSRDEKFIPFIEVDDTPKCQNIDIEAVLLAHERPFR